MNQPKIITIYSKSHQIFFKDYFSKTIEEPFEAKIIEQRSKTGMYNTEGYRESMIDKVDFIIKNIEQKIPENNFFVFTDVDVQFFGRILPFCERLLKNNPDIDIFFQSDSRFNLTYCAGLFVTRCNQRTLNLWKKVRQVLCDNADIPHDQDALNIVIHKKLIKNCKISFLPTALFWSVCHSTNDKRWVKGDTIVLPSNILVHHANWAKGIDTKVELLNVVRNKFNYDKNHKLKHGILYFKHKLTYLPLYFLIISKKIFYTLKITF